MATQAEYVEVTSGSCTPITSSAACASAAQALGLSDTTVSEDGQSGVSFDPPYCYYESNSLKYNNNGTNTGACSSNDKCLCLRHQACSLGCRVCNEIVTDITKIVTRILQGIQSGLTSWIGCIWIGFRTLPG